MVTQPPHKYQKYLDFVELKKLDKTTLDPGFFGLTMRFCEKYDETMEMFLECKMSPNVFHIMIKSKVEGWSEDKLESVLKKYI